MNRSRPTLLLALNLLALNLLVSAAEAQQTRPTPAAANTITKAKAKAKPAKSTAKKPAAAPEPVIVFARMPCFGRCPHFTALIFPDGRVQYEGFEHAPVLGKRELRMSPASIQAILREADKIGFRKLQSTYSSGAADLPTTSLRIRYANGTTKAVSAEDEVPAGLQQLFTLVNTELDKVLGVSNDR